ncbi:MAG: NmrA family NAD(P)-binding protein [Pseudomonadota bacterium]
MSNLVYPAGNRKSVPKRTLIFGAGGHLGGPCAATLAKIAPGMSLRVTTSRPEGLDALRAQFPDAEAVVADLFDIETLRRALEGVEGLWIVTPDFTDEDTAMGNLVRAAAEVTEIVHATRMAGDIPGLTPSQMRPFIKRFGRRGPAMQHHVAAEILSAEMPTTIVNSVYLFDNFTRYFAGPIREFKTLILPFDLRIGFIDADDIGAFAAHLLASDNHRHIGQKYNMDNGEDVMRFSEVVAMMSEVLGEKIQFVGDPEAFLENVGPQINMMIGEDAAAQYFVENWWMEHENEVMFRKSDVFESVTGYRAKPFRQWLDEHRNEILGA